jgi:hypothetical protein
MSVANITNSIILIAEVIILIVIIIIIAVYTTNKNNCPYRLCEEENDCKSCPDCRCSNNTDPDCVPCPEIKPCRLTCEADCNPPSCKIKNASAVWSGYKPIYLDQCGYLTAKQRTPYGNQLAEPMYSDTAIDLWTLTSEGYLISGNYALGRYTDKPGTILIMDSKNSIKEDNKQLFTWKYDGYNIYTPGMDYILAFNRFSSNYNFMYNTLYLSPANIYANGRKTGIIIG